MISRQPCSWTNIRVRRSTSARSETAPHSTQIFPNPHLSVQLWVGKLSKSCQHFLNLLVKEKQLWQVNVLSPRMPLCGTLSLFRTSFAGCYAFPCVSLGCDVSTCKPYRVVFEVFELSSAKEGRVCLLVDVFPCASWCLVKVRTSAWRATWKTLVWGLTWREWAQESSIAAAAPQTVMDWRRQARGSDEESNYKESDIDRQKKVLPVARGLGRRRSWFHCPCRVRLSYLRPSPFLLAISSTETLFAYAGEGGRGEWCGLLATWKSSLVTQLTNELRDTHGEARRTRTWHRLTKGSLGSSGILVALEYNVKEGDVDWRRAT